MKQRKMTIGALGVLLMMFTMFHSTAHAYIDPGTGSIILQAIVGGVFAVLLGGKIFWGKITGLFSSRLPETKESTDNNDDQR